MGVIVVTGGDRRTRRAWPSGRGDRYRARADGVAAALAVGGVDLAEEGAVAAASIPSSGRSAAGAIAFLLSAESASITSASISLSLAGAGA